MNSPHSTKNTRIYLEFYSLGKHRYYKFCLVKEEGFSVKGYIWAIGISK